LRGNHGKTLQLPIGWVTIWKVLSRGVTQIGIANPNKYRTRSDIVVWGESETRRKKMAACHMWTRHHCSIWGGQTYAAYPKLWRGCFKTQIHDLYHQLQWSNFSVAPFSA